MKNVSLVNLFYVFLKIGVMSFGGGYSMIPFIQEELVKKYKWISDEKAVDILALAQILPGGVAINSSTLIGAEILGKRGAAVATVAVTLPSIIIMIVASMFITTIMEFKIIQSIFKGIKIGVIVLIIIAAKNLTITSLRDKINVIIFLIFGILLIIFKLNPINAIASSIALGVVYYIFITKLLRKDKKV